MRFFALIPAFNDGDTVAEIAAETARQCPVIVVDDGSSDRTPEALASVPVTVLRNPRNQGKAWSLHRGFQEALRRGADAVVTLDADGQHPVAELPRLLDAAREEPGSVIMAARVLDREQIPPLRLFAHRNANFWISWAAGYPILDTQSGFRVYPATLLRQLDLPCDPHRSFVFESEALIRAAKLGYSVRSVPIRAIYRADARPSHYRPAVDTLRIIRMVAGHLVRSGLNPAGLLRSLSQQPR
ncbi:MULTISPECIES: glycosyltransferase family 2 protein [unclassified Halorhodospira]|uniref:glycosyltransferase family 2 protein n=1 Tax=unclassified Halorhodospira TaxID=2626748 RepID=UPI001EE823DF|nr:MULTISPECIES: glycosyltransferase family 2 protein [unclassified Halorhodospira]MCG5537194.1 glycosyltransferase family 2 protein [Halorhodospira sp. 9622]MCG5540242.1 glycosyltransferase family 2 protein [Halorhodospira sp. M39old]MCG5545057.1 glycosyltransferase family 2 protein [Halorhodospira sp. M38]